MSLVISLLFFFLAAAAVGGCLWMVYSAIVGVPRFTPNAPYIRAFFLIVAALVFLLLFFGIVDLPGV